MAILNISHYRFGADDAAHASHSFLANEDTALASVTTFDTPMLLRFNEQLGSATNNVDFQFRYKVNAGAWASVSTSSSPIKAATSAFSTDADDLTQRLSGTGTFESSGDGFTIDGISGGAQNDIALSGCSETELCFSIVSASVVSGDVIYFDGTSPDCTVATGVLASLAIYKAAATSTQVYRYCCGRRWRN